VGKTTTAVNLGAALAGRGKRVLLVDIDPQANLSLHLNVDVQSDKGTIYDLLVGHRAVADLVRELPTPNLSILPSSIDLCSAELELVNTVGRELLLRDGLNDYIDGLDASFDYVLIDCPPSLGLLSLNALAASQEVFVPIQAEFFALQGMGKLMEVVELVRERLNPMLRVTGIVVCMFRSQTNLAKEVLREVQGFFGDVVFETRIRQNIKLAEAPSHGKDIFAYDRLSYGAQDYGALADEILARDAGLKKTESPVAEEAPSAGAAGFVPAEQDDPSAVAGPPAPVEPRESAPPPEDPGLREEERSPADEIPRVEEEDRTAAVLPAEIQAEESGIESASAEDESSKAAGGGGMTETGRISDEGA
jgi:chromosome partitioning protein